MNGDLAAENEAGVAENGNDNCELEVAVKSLSVRSACVLPPVCEIGHHYPYHRSNGRRLLADLFQSQFFLLIGKFFFFFVLADSSSSSRFLCGAR